MVRHSREDLEIWLQILAQSHNRSYISASVAVVWSRPNSNYILGGEMVLVAFVDQLMRASDQLKVVDVVELALDVRALLE